MSKKRVYSDDERVIRIWDIETVKDLMSRRQVMQRNNERREELEKLWVTEPKYRATASLGSNWGYYVGMDEISRHYVADYTDTLQKALDEKCDANSAIENIRDNFGCGDLIAHHVSTPCVVLADDGQTAKGVWYSLGAECTGNPDGSCKAMWYPERVCADFVKEANGEWKIWHFFVGTDFSWQAGQPYSEPEFGPRPERPPQYGVLRIPDLYTSKYGWSSFPHFPVPYETWTPEISYGPEPFMKEGE